MSVSAAATRIFLAVESPSLRRVIEHLLRDLPDMELARTTEMDVLAGLVPGPDVIVVSARMMGRGNALSAAALRRACPHARIIVITADREWWWDEVAQGTADASFDEEDVVRCLAPIVQILAAGTFPVAAD
jgi:DNA-binding NarL/FixJ family response regulator